jgi:hypothetical protein
MEKSISAIIDFFLQYLGKKQVFNAFISNINCFAITDNELRLILVYLSHKSDPEIKSTSAFLLTTYF